MNKVITRASKAGKLTGEALIEMVHLMYQNNTAKSFLLALYNEILTGIKRRKIKIKEYNYE